MMESNRLSLLELSDVDDFQWNVPKQCLLDTALKFVILD